MKIIDNTLQSFTVSELEVGTTFKHSDDYYLRIENTMVNGVTYNAVELDTGKLCSFFRDAQVFPFNCELIVL